MKKQRKQMILLLLVLVVLVGGYFGVQYYNENAVPEETVKETEYVLEIEEDSIQRIAYSYEDAEYAFAKNGEDWTYETDATVNLDSYYINLMESRCEKMSIKDKIENVTDMSQYGLADPERYISFETAETVYTFYVGDHNKVSNGYYVCEPESNTVYLVEYVVIAAFNKTLEDLIEEEAEETEE